MWRINREAALLLGGPAAAILQAAHPEIAAGVAAHSTFRSDPLGRLHRTLDAIYTVTFSPMDEVKAMSADIAKRHSRVRGTEPVAYSAASQDASLWVIATLMMTGLWIFESLIGEVTRSQKDEYLIDMREFGKYFGLRPDFGPQNFVGFAAYYDEILTGDLLGSHPICAEVAGAVLCPVRPRGLAILSVLLAPLVIETVPEPIRSKLGFRSTWGGRIAFRVARAVLKVLLPIAPSGIRFIPQYRRSKREIARLRA